MLALAALAVVRFGLQLAVGPEYDSNANRAEVVAGSESPDVAVGSFLLRTAANGQLAWKSGDNLLRLSGTLAGKIYFNPAVFDQDTLAIQLAAEDRIRVARFLHLAIAGDYYDSFQLDVPPYRHRDFRSGTAQARVYFVDPLGEVALSGGYRGFDYKPDPYFAFQAAVASASAITRIHVGANEDHEIDVAAGYHLERRFFSGLIQELDGRQCPPGHPIVDACLQAGTVDRQDWFHEGGLELTYVGPLLVGAGYGLQLNLSNSFGQGLLRQLVSFKLGYRLPWNLYATLKAQLYVTRYLDPVLLDHAFQSITFISIEDENRNSVLVDLERPIGATGLAINARYSVYTNELSPSPVSFLRQVIFLGLTYRVGAR